jgi:hypothetical protein
MSKKTVPFKMPVRAADPAEAWVASRDGGEITSPDATVTPLVQPTEPMKRFTIDVGEGLHKRIKMQCAGRGAKMADVIRDLLEKEFPDGRGTAGQGA